MALCPICRMADADPKYKPFCSRRCSDLDLQRWFAGSYVIAGEPSDGADEEPQKD